MRHVSLFFFISVIGLGLLLPMQTKGAEYNFTYRDLAAVTLDDATARKGYTINMFDDSIRFGITPGLLTAGGAFEFKEVELSENSGMEIPHGYSLVSKILEFDVKNKEAYDPSKPFWLQMKFESELGFDKFLFYFDQGKGRWVELPSRTDLENGYVRAAFHLPFAKLAVFDTEVMAYGDASWYAYKDCMCAASPDYPKGTQLLVTDLDHNTAVVVTVNDWGPERDIFPRRVIDLDVVAFEKFASRRAGVLVNMHVSPYMESNFTEEERGLLAAGDVLELTADQVSLAQGVTPESGILPEKIDEATTKELAKVDVEEEPTSTSKYLFLE